MEIDWWTLGLQTINVVVLLWILQRFLFKPVAAVVAARQAEAAAVLEKAEALREEAEAERDKARSEGARLAADRKSLVDAARAEAETTRATLLAAAREEVDRLHADAAADIARSRAAADRDNASNARTLAAAIAERLLDRLPPEARLKGFAAGLGQAVAGLPPHERRKLAEAPSIVVRATRQPAVDEVADLRAVLSDALGADAKIETVAEPGLIAGYELEAGDIVVRNSFRADLDRLLREIARDDHAV